MTVDVQLTAVDILSQTREHLTPPGQWVKGSWQELGQHGQKVQACSMGAMLLAKGITDQELGHFGTQSRELMESDPEFKRAVFALAAAVYDLGVSVDPSLDYDGGYITDPRDPWGYFHEETPVDFIIEANDNTATTHAEILAAFDHAIKELKSA